MLYFLKEIRHFILIFANTFFNNYIYAIYDKTSYKLIFKVNLLLLFLHGFHGLIILFYFLVIMFQKLRFESES